MVALVKGVNVLLGEGPGNIGPYSEFATLICILESLKVSQCPIFPILYAIVFVEAYRPHITSIEIPTTTQETGESKAV
jgi:hypothetical protein